MAGYFSKYGAFVFSKCTYTNTGVGYADLETDYPLVLGADSYYDTVAVYRTWGRDPGGAPLFVDQTVDRYTTLIVTEGIASASSQAVPELYATPDMAVIAVESTDAATLNTINLAADHFVVAAWGVNENELTPAQEEYALDAEMSSDRFTELRTYMIARGISSTTIDSWRTNNPNATNQEVVDKAIQVVSS